MLIRPASWDDERLAPFRDVADATLAARDGLCLVEGRLVVRRLLAGTRCRPRAVLVTEAAHAALADALEPWTDRLPIHVVPQDWMRPLTGFNLHRGCLALAERPPMPSVDEIARDARRLLVLEGVGNPDNVGGLFRTALAFGVDGLLAGPGTGDPLYRKAIRVSCGAALSVPFADATPWPDVLRDLRRTGIVVWALTPSGDARPIADVCAAGIPDRLALLVGSEGSGLSEEALAAADVRVRIPINPAADSLNVVVAAGIAMERVTVAGR
ncbi:MAG TPA: RNA methyltransferase [Vicinamibacterales bacterium]